MAKTRSEIMAAVKSANTAPELFIRKALYKRGFRYRINDKRLPGKPDLVFTKYGATIMINGCFWHGHGCRKVNIPASNKEYWIKKIGRNIKNDSANIKELQKLGWRVMVLWECTIFGKAKIDAKELIDKIEKWLKQGKTSIALPE